MMLYRISRLFTFLLLMSCTCSVFALEFPLPKPGDNIVGNIQIVRVKPGDTIYMIARQYDMGFQTLMAANPGLDNPYRLRVGQEIVIPSQFVLPNTHYKGIVINLAEMRLYYYPPDRASVITVPIGIGRLGWETPVGVLRVIEKIKNPSWHVPDSIRHFRAEEGVILPKIVPPGPDNPLGDYAMRLSRPNYLLHGTNDPNGVGRRSSGGCIRIYPEDIENLFSMVDVNTTVRIINEPFKAGWLNGQLYLEAYKPLDEQADIPEGSLFNLMAQVVNTAAMMNTYRTNVNWPVARRIAVMASGIPMPVGQ